MAGPRDEVLKRIEKKRAEIAVLEVQIREANSYIQALEDMLKILPRDAGGSETANSVVELRPGSAVARTREAILAAGHPLHITDILKHLGRPADNVSRAAVSGSLSAYVRKGEIFTRPAPNTFGLIEVPSKSPPVVRQRSSSPTPPLDFGLGSGDEDELALELDVEEEPDELTSTEEGETDNKLDR